jgi:uncharacterized protein (DUF2336 family)
MKKVLKSLFGGVKEKTLTYEEAKKLAGHEDVAVRMSLAARDDMKAELLYYLAEDESADVRRLIASNQATPRQADVVLAKDKDEEVRAHLAQKISSLVPGLDRDAEDKVARMTFEVLETLARDQATRVRQILSETLKDVAQAPPAVIKRLARDAEIAVAGPVLRCSPVLTDEDLIEIIRSDPIRGALGAISGRPEVSANVADAIVDADDEEAIALLLANDSAQIREATLDRVVDRAADVEVWHAPLVKRPQLPAKAAKKIARFLAENLIKVLLERADLDAETVEQVKKVVDRRIEDGDLKPAGEGKFERPAGESPEAAAKRLHGEKKLDEKLLESAIAAGDSEFAIAAIALLADVPAKVVGKAVTTQSPKGVLAVSWKAGLSAKFAEQAQLKLARIRPKEVLKPKGGQYPLEKADLEWQLDFFRDLAARGK